MCSAAVLRNTRYSEGKMSPTRMNVSLHYPCILPRSYHPDAVRSIVLFDQLNYVSTFYYTRDVGYPDFIVVRRLRPWD